MNELAFEGPGEAGLVDALRDSAAWVPGLSLVAEVDSEVVGHILFSLVEIDGGAPLLSLGPMAVAPDRQRAGVGTALVERGLALAARTEYPLVVVVGHAAYYPRFGFEPARALGIDTPYDVPDETWLAVKLPRYRDGIRGTVRYPPPWAALG